MCDRVKVNARACKVQRAAEWDRLREREGESYDELLKLHPLSLTFLVVSARFLRIGSHVDHKDQNVLITLIHLLHQNNQVNTVLHCWRGTQRY